jgi:hypothetical protein
MSATPDCPYCAPDERCALCLAADRIDLYGHDRQPFPNFTETATYLERVNFPDHADAVAFMRDYGYDTQVLAPVWMRRENRGGGDAWWECEPDHSDAVPFWRDGPEA